MATGVHANYSDVLYMTSIELMRTGQFDSAYRVVNQLYLVGEQKLDSLQIVRAIAVKASIMRRQGHLDSAMRAYNTALTIARRKAYLEQSKNILNSLGLLYILEARYDVALRHLFESLELRQKISDENELSIAFHNIGFVYQKLENYDRALFYYNKSLTLREQSMKRDDMEQLLLNIGWCYVNKTQYDTAFKYFDAAFTECNEGCSEKFLIDAFLGLGYIARYQNEFERAEEHFIKSYSLARKHNDVRQALDNIVQLSEIYIAQHKTVLAEKYLTEAEMLIISDGRYRLELAGIYRQFSDLYGKTNNLRLKVFYQEKYIVLKDSIFNYQVTANLMKAESNFVERESKARIEAQNKIMELNEEIIFRQQVANIAFGLVAVFGITLAGVLARRNKAKQRTNLLLDRKVVERTHELRMNQELIQRAFEDKALLVQKTTSELHSLISTTKGLCFLGRQEKDINRCQEYWRRLDATTEGMGSTIAKLSATQTSRERLLLEKLLV
jgi:tetratricopeptide (TPR) repeat protein